MIDEFDSKSSSEHEKIDNWEFGFDDDNLTEIEIDRRCKEQMKNEYFEEHKKNKTEPNGIVEIKYGDDMYKIWYLKTIKSYLIKFLKIAYTDSIIVPEFNHIDNTIFDNRSDDITPVEIQKTPIKNTGHGNKFTIAEFEDRIRRQLEDNIENYGKCWFFFDSEFLRFLQSSNVRINTNINMTWIVKLMKDNTLRTFTIKYDGEVKELTTKDFDFLKDISQTCSLGYDNDERILNRNKLKIYRNILKGYNFTQEEIFQFENNFDNRGNNEPKGSNEYFKKSNNERCKLYGNVTESANRLLTINECLHCNKKEKISYTIDCVNLGLFYQNDFHGQNNNARIQFIDKFDVAKYFPGYLKNKDLWDYCKEKKRVFTIGEFNGIIEGGFNYEFIKKQHSLFDY